MLRMLILIISVGAVGAVLRSGQLLSPELAKAWIDITSRLGSGGFVLDLVVGAGSGVAFLTPALIVVFGCLAIVASLQGLWRDVFRTR